MAAKKKREKARPDYEKRFAGLRKRTRVEAFLDFLSKSSRIRVVTLVAMGLLFWIGRELVKAGSIVSGQVVIGLIFLIWLVVTISEWRARVKSSQEASPNPEAQPGNEPDGTAEARRPP